MRMKEVKEKIEQFKKELNNEAVMEIERDFCKSNTTLHPCQVTTEKQTATVRTNCISPVANPIISHSVNKQPQTVTN